MICFSSVDDIDLNLYDEVWYITATNPRMKKGCSHHPELAPSYDLFVKYRYGGLSLQEYFDKYRAELESRTSAVQHLVDLSASGKWIQCVCYCIDYCTCHRNVTYSYISAVGADCCIS